MKYDSVSRMYQPSKHVALLGILENEDKLVDAVDFVLNALNKRPERVRDVVDERVRDPIGRDRNVVAQMLDAAAYVLWVWSWAEVKL